MMKLHMSWRLASRLSVITLAILTVIIVLVIQQQRAASSSLQLQGTDLGKREARNFTLTDQYNNKVSLSQFRGKPVVLTFLYTHCPDVCPLTAEYLHQSMVQLGKDASRVGVLAVSTDPQRDDVAAALTFSHGELLALSGRQQSRTGPDLVQLQYLRTVDAAAGYAYLCHLYHR